MTDVVERSLRRLGVTVSRPVLGVIAIIFGILLIIFPPLIAYLIGNLSNNRGYSPAH